MSLLVLAVFLSTFLSKPIYSLFKIDENWGYLSLSSHFKNSIWDRHKKFVEFEKNLVLVDCIFIDLSTSHQLIYLYIKNIYNFEYIIRDKYFKNQNSTECLKKIIIQENKITYL